MRLNLDYNLYPTYDIHQSTASEYICGIVLWLGQYHDNIVLRLGQYHDIALRGQLEACRIQTVKVPQAGQSGVNALVHNHIGTYNIRALPSSFMY